MLPASPGRALTASARAATREVSAKVVEAVAPARPAKRSRASPVARTSLDAVAERIA